MRPTGRDHVNHFNEGDAMIQTPKTHRDHLIPVGVAAVPSAVQGASEQLRLAGLAVDLAGARRLKAQEAEKSGPRRDADAAVDALRAGKEPNPKAHSQAIREREAAELAESAARRIADDALMALERAIRDHQGPWMEAMRWDIEAHAGQALAALDEAQPALELLQRVYSAYGTVSRPPNFERGRAFPEMTGRTLHAQPLVKALDTVRTEIAELVEDAKAAAPPTPEELAKREGVRAQQSHYKAMARGGVSVTGG